MRSLPALAYLHEKKLTTRARAFVETLEAADLRAGVVPGSARDYSIKVHVSRGEVDLGCAVLYYGKKGFSMKTHELAEPRAADVLTCCWEGRDATGALQALNAALDAPDAVEDVAYHAYVDGSFMDRRGCGFGAVILHDDEPIAELSGPAEASSMRNVAGEMQAVLEVLAWCEAGGVDEIVIFHDYAGLAAWPTGLWKAKAYATQAYAERVRTCDVRVIWRKVEAHSGNRWNDRADELAKEGVGLVPDADAGRR